MSSPMSSWTPLGHHPDSRDLTPQWVRILSLFLVGVSIFAMLSIGTEFGTGIFLLSIGSSNLVSVWYNRKDLSAIGLRSIAWVIDVAMVLAGIYFIFKP